MVFIIGIFQFHFKSEQRQVKWNKIKQDFSCLHFSLFTSIKVFQLLLKFILVINLIPKINDNSPGGKMAIIWFYSINVKGNWAHLAEKNSRAGAKITTTEGAMKIFVLS